MEVIFRETISERCELCTSMCRCCGRSGSEGTKDGLRLILNV